MFCDKFTYFHLQNMTSITITDYTLMFPQEAMS